MGTKKTGVLLVNLGSPAAPTAAAIRQFLKAFLWDPRVVRLPRFIWWLVLHCLVLPLRPKKLVPSYQKIWLQQGSPLTFLSHQLAAKVALQVDKTQYSVACAMRYGEPSIASKLEQYKKNGTEKIIIIPLYPQYSSTTTASVYDAVFYQLQQWQSLPSIRFVSNYHQHPRYIEAIAQSITQAWQQRGKNELLLLSFHGLPAKLIQYGDPYLSQCQASAERIAEKLDLTSEQWKMVFQSRFGRAKWLQPYCVEVLQLLPKQGIKKVDVVCPGFAVDCLETLEEIALSNKNHFLLAGGEEYRYIPALNDSQHQVATMVDLIRAE